MKMTLIEKQQLFSKMVALFINDLSERGYAVTLGEAFRPLLVAKMYADQKTGIINSNHVSRLAIDLNIFLNGKYLLSKEDLLIPGKLWKSYSTDMVECVWGGDFEEPDSDHYSFSHNGIK